MRDKNLSLEEVTVNLQPQQQNESFIIKDFMAAGIEGYLLAELNMCHPALNATCRSDISTGDSKSISPNALKGKNNWTINRYTWPLQPSPHLKSWGNFQVGLTYTYNLFRTLAQPPSLKLGT